MGWLRDSATSLLAKIKTVDGSGSGLDADLLDGHDSSYFASSGSAITSLTGDVTATGPGAAAATIAAGAVTEAKQTLSDVTTGNVSTTKHGYAPKGDGSVNKFLNANGAYSQPTDVTGNAQLPDGVEMVMPGDNIKMTVELISPIAMEEGLRFAIREGGRTVGAGVVSKILQ